jgi:hypothetical protein
LLSIQVVSPVRQVMAVGPGLGAVFEMPVLSVLAGQILPLHLARFNPETLAPARAARSRAGVEAPPSMDDAG